MCLFRGLRTMKKFGEFMTASEALFGFAAWLTCQKDPVTFGSTVNSSPMVDLVTRWMTANDLPPPREGIYPKNIVQPEQKH